MYQLPDTAETALLALNHEDASLYLLEHPKLRYARVQVLTTAGHPLTIRGTVAGAKYEKVYVTDQALLGPSYAEAMQLLERELAKTPGATLEQLHAPRIY